MINERLFNEIITKIRKNDKNSLAISIDIARLYKDCINKKEISELYEKFVKTINYKKDTVRKKRKTGEFLLEHFSKSFIDKLSCQYYKIEIICNKSETILSVEEKIKLIKKLSNNEDITIPNEKNEKIKVSFSFTDYERQELELLLKQNLENYLKKKAREIENGLKFKLRIYLQDKAYQSIEALTNFLIFVSGVRKCKRD